VIAHLSVECPERRGPSNKSPAGSAVADVQRPTDISDRLLESAETFFTAAAVTGGKPLSLQG